MPSTYGTLDWDSEGNIVATFDKINKVFEQIAADTSQRASSRAVEGKEASSSTGSMIVYGKLTYDDLDDLTSTRSYVGSIGDLSYTIVFDNGPVIEGMANQPGLVPLIDITGSGVWRDL